MDVVSLLDEEMKVTEFESLDLAVLMLFLAGKHSYPVTQQISAAIRAAGFDGLVYPSFFSMVRNGTKPFETVYGLSQRILPQYAELEQAKIAPNYAIFGHPIRDKLVEVVCINRVVLNSVTYSVHFGPVDVF